MATGYYLLDNPQHRDYPQCGYPRRNGAKATGTIILHDAEGGTDLDGADMGAENVANFIRTRASFGSYHDLVDRDTHIPMAPIDYETWHSIPDNPWSYGICVAWTKADLPRMSYAQRRSYYVPLARAVLKAVAKFAARGIHVPIGRMLSAAETQARKPGVSTHSRTDPTRRSDPFGTGSVYENEFLAVLAEMAAGTTPTQEDDDMTPMEMLEARFKTGRKITRDGVEIDEEVRLVDALKAIYFYGDTLHRQIGAEGDRAVAETSAAYHQLVGELDDVEAAVKAVPPGTVDGQVDLAPLIEAINKLPQDVVETLRAQLSK